MGDKVYVLTMLDVEELESHVIGVFDSKEKAKAEADKEKEDIFNDPDWGPWDCCIRPDRDCVESCRRMYEFEIRCEVVK
jgi:hypothetical protein